MTNYNSLEAILKKEIEKDEKDFKEVGIVVSVFDGIVIAYGLLNGFYGEKVLINNEIIGLILHMDMDQVKILVIDNYHLIQEEQIIYRTKQIFSIKLPKKIHSLLGGSFDLNDLIKNQYEGEETIDVIVDKEAPNFTSRDFINEPIHTGVMAIDTMMPIGRGQRQLILGNVNSGKTTLVGDIIISQKNNVKKLYCIYVNIGQKLSSVKTLEEMFKKEGVFSYSIIINASAAQNIGLQYIAPYVSMAIAETFSQNGEDSIVFFDDLTKHAIAYRSIKLLLRDIPGREAYSGDIFYLHSRLLERCGKFQNGSSITGIPILSTYDVTGYIPTNVISITDGQLFLDTDLFNKGQRPAINVGISVSRLGGAVQSKIMKKVCKSLKVNLSAAEELENFAQFVTDLDEESIKILQNGRNIKKILKQVNKKPYKLWEEIVILYGVLYNIVTDVNLDFFQNIFKKIEKDHKNIIYNIERDEYIDETLEEIRKVLCN